MNKNFRKDTGMKRKLSEMTLEQLWKLFPIVLTEHKLYWHSWYEEESKGIQTFLPMSQIRHISHIGSTAIETIWAKPIIDILVEMQETCKRDEMISDIVKSGYIVMHLDNNRVSFNKGYTIDGFAEKVFHLHLRYKNDNEELYFRDYLNDYADIAKKYEQIKLKLWKEYPYNRDAYTKSKTHFIRKYTEKAKLLYGEKYIKF